MNITDRQFDALAELGRAGGFTVIPKGPHAGLPPRNKFLVGQADSPEGHADTGPGIKSYAVQHEATLDRPNRFLGGWGSTLDVPRGFPTTPRGEVAARIDTIKNTQEAYGEMDSNRAYAGSHYNPFHPVNRGEIQAHDTPEQRDAWIKLPLHAAQFKKKGPSVDLLSAPHQGSFS